MTAFLITGIPGAGKTTVSTLLARRLPRAAHVEADRLHEMIVSGRVWPHEEPHDEAMRQLEVRAAAAAALARELRDGGFVPVIDDVIVGPRRLSVYTEALGPLRVVVLAPRLEVALERDAGRHKHVAERWRHLDAEMRERLQGPGIEWLDTSDLSPEETVDAILAPNVPR